LETRKSAIVGCLDYQMPDTQFKGSKGDGDMHAAKLLSEIAGRHLAAITVFG